MAGGEQPLAHEEPEGRLARQRDRVEQEPLEGAIREGERRVAQLLVGEPALREPAIDVHAHAADLLPDLPHVVDRQGEALVVHPALVGFAASAGWIVNK